MSDEREIFENTIGKLRYLPNEFEIGENGHYKHPSVYADFLVWQAARQDWQPISTAPKDGTPILVFNNHEGGYHTEAFDIGVAAWTEYDGLGKPNWASIACCDGVSYYTPTHWMPLPPAPKGGENER